MATDKRKENDTLILSGVLSAATAIPDATWVGAICKVNIADNTTRELFLDHGDVVLSLVGTDHRYRYVGPMPPKGTYLYELEVTFLDTTVLTFPNDGVGKLFKVIAQLG